MKSQLAYKLLLLALLMINSFADAKEPWIEKKKVITSNYPLANQSIVKIKNAFGDVNVNNWNKNEVKVEVTITVKSNSEKLAQELLDQIYINENNGSTISFETKIGENGSNNNNIKVKNNDAQFHINYVVFLPQSTVLEIKNSFGDTKLQDRNGITTLYQTYGDVTMGNLSNLNIAKIEYGDLKGRVISVKEIKATYSDLDIQSIEGNVDGSCTFGDVKIGISPTIQQLNLKLSYSDLYLSLPISLNATFDIKTSFSDLSNKSSLRLDDLSKKEKYGSNINKVYSGKSGNGKATVYITSTYGDIRLRNQQ